MNEKIKTCCFTGHRKIKQADVYAMTINLNTAIKKAIQNGVDTFVCGGALGFDMVAANLILCLKEMGEQIRLVLVLPCEEQERFWNKKEQDNYKHILSEADEIQYITDRYFKGCMEQRNQKMVELAGMCIAYLRHEKSGTAQTVRMANEKGIPVVKL